MSGITTGTGMMSGMPIDQIVSQLMQLEARPREQVRERNEALNEKQEALRGINTQLLSLKTTASDFTNILSFRENKASSSNEDIATASARRSAAPGSYEFIVDQLASSQQVFSNRAFSAEEAVGEGVLSFQRDEARLDRQSELKHLNGGEGVERGRIRITDGSGQQAEVDLSRALTIDDVLDAINTTSGLGIRAEIDGDRLNLVDTSGGGGSIQVQNTDGRMTANQLGFLDGQQNGDVLEGAQVNRIGEDTELSALNDGQGVGIRHDRDDMLITDRDGQAHQINLDGAETLEQVMDRIDEQSGGAVTARVAADGVRLELVDQSGGGGTLSVEALNGSSAAGDLGVLGEADPGSDTIQGHRLIAAMNSGLIRHLNGGEGVNLGEIEITDADGTAAQIDLSGAESIQELIDRINASDADVEAAVNGSRNGLVIRDRSGGGGALQISDLSGSAAEDLNLAGTYDGRRPQADSGNLNFQFVSEATSLSQLGAGEGRFEVRDGFGRTMTIDTAGEDINHIGDVIRRINDSNLHLEARVNDSGDGILLSEDHPDGLQGGTPITVSDLEGEAAANLGLAGEAEGVGQPLDGSLTVRIEVDEEDTLQDLAQRINSSNAGVRAGVSNTSPDGSSQQLMLNGEQSGKAGAFLLDDGGLGLRMQTLSEARDARVFFGSQDPASGVAITTSSNSMNNVIPGVDVDLNNPGDAPVRIDIERDAEAVTEKVEGFVEKFNEILEVLDELDHYDEEEEEASLLLGDPTIARVRRSLFNTVMRREDDLPSSLSSLSEVGIRVGEGARLEFDADRFSSAFENDRQAVEQLFAHRHEQENDEGETELVPERSGLGVQIDNMLDRLTRPDHGTVQTRLNALDRQIGMNANRIESMTRMLEGRRERLERQFLNMERALAQMQDQSQAIMQMSMSMGRN